MPRKVTAYACSYGCGRRVTTKKASMLEHEQSYCFKNPKHQTCMTCKFDTKDYTGYRYEFYACAKELRPKDIMVIRFCVGWEKKP